MSKKSFILYLDQQELFNKLPDEIAGKLIKHIFSYVNCENPVTDDLVLDIAFESIKQALKRDLKSWEMQRKQRSDAGKKSAEVRANKKQRKSTESTSVKSRSTESTVSVSVNVNDSVNVTDNKKKQKGFIKPSVSDVKSYILEKSYNVRAEQWMDYYISNGWMVGRTKMKDWKAAVRTWNGRSKNNEKTGNNQKSNLTAVERVVKAGHEQERREREREQEQIDITAHASIVGEDGQDIWSQMDEHK